MIPLTKFTVILILFFPICFTASCRNHSDLIEAELRTRNREIEELRQENDVLKGRNYLYEQTYNLNQKITAPSGTVYGPLTEIKESGTNRTTIPTPLIYNPKPGNSNSNNPSIISNPPINPQPPTNSLPPGSKNNRSNSPLIKQVILGKGTGVNDYQRNNSIPGLVVVLVPEDEDGSAIKLPGRVLIQAFEIYPNGSKILLSTWDIDETQLRKSWQSGLFTSGFFVKIPYKKLPSQPNLRIVAQYTLANGQFFEAEKDVTVLAYPPAVPFSGTIPPIQPKNPSDPEPTSIEFFPAPKGKK